MNKVASVLPFFNKKMCYVSLRLELIDYVAQPIDQDYFQTLIYKKRN